MLILVTPNHQARSDREETRIDIVHKFEVSQRETASVFVGQWENYKVISIRCSIWMTEWKTVAIVFSVVFLLPHILDFSSKHNQVKGTRTEYSCRKYCIPF